MLQRTKLVVANWKMHLQQAAIKEYFTRCRELQNFALGQTEVACAAPSPYLMLVRECFKGLGWQLGAQNVARHEQGAYTGEVSAPMLKDVGVRYGLVGHSERRQLFGESDQVVGFKAKALQDQGLVPILCVGETLEERRQSLTTAVVTSQVQAVLPFLRPGAPYVLAYEPVWAIGTGQVATPEGAQEVHGLIRKTVSHARGAAEAQALRLLYGGSVKAQNFGQLLQQPDIDGGLVGGASLDPAEFTQIIRAATA